MDENFLSKEEIVEAIKEQNEGKPDWILQIGEIYFCKFLTNMPNPRRIFTLRFSNLIRGGWCDIVLDTKKIGGTQDAVESVDP